jgi:threonylcarbamoyladenosine tRNA methylthiotransferase MtaB
MKRKYSLKQFIEMCDYIKKKNKQASITTDYIVGFPTETSEQFIDSLKNLKRIKFSDMHIFPFSSRPFTAASKLKNIVSDYERKTRFIAIDKLNKQFQKGYLKQFIGKKVNVLFEHSNKPNIQSGHSEYFFTTNIKTNKTFTNKMLQVKITSLVDNQLFGTTI